MKNNKAIFSLLKKRPKVTAAVLVAVIILLGAITLGLSTAKDSYTDNDMPTFAVQRGPLRISVIESGTIKAREQVIIKSQVEGRTTILSLVPEGTLVREGDLLVELDASQLMDNKIDQEIRVQNGEAAYIGAKENLAVVENQAKSDIDKAQLNLEFARQDYKKYIEGEYPNQLKEAEAQITLYEEELARAQEKLKWSKTLYEEKYISQIELQADELAEKKRALDLELAKNNRDLLKDFTYKRNLAQLISDVNQAEMAFERTERKARADVKQAEASLLAKEAEYNRQKDKLEKVLEQIEKTKIYAPADGLVIYATSAKGSWRGNQEPLEEGQDVHEREELIYLPTALVMKAEVKIHESSMKKVDLTLPAIIRVDALPGKVFTGTVGKIAPLPDPQMIWLNPDLKVYNTEIYINEEDSELRTGMSCKAEIIIEEYKDATYIPVQAVLRVAGEPTVYVVNGKKIEPRKVEIGLDNNRMIRIMKGLTEGEIVSLAPPLKSAEAEPTAVAAVESFPSVEKAVERKSEEKTITQEPVAKDDSSEEQETMRRRFENMTPEEREKLRQRFENMSPEEREKMRQQRRGRRQQTNESQ